MADPVVSDAVTSLPALNIGQMSFERVTAVMRRMVPRVTADQIETFLAVLGEGLCNQTEVSKRTGHSRQATSRHVAKLVKAGLIVQSRDLEDGRRWNIRLTPRGRLVPASLKESARKQPAGR